MEKLLAVGLGGALGAILRYLISLLPWRGDFPLLTLLTNLLGAVAIGFIAGAAARSRIAALPSLFWKTGVCGGFTTFSTFSLEAVSLLESGSKALGMLYILLSVLLCLGGVCAGQAAASLLLKQAAQ
ncbi:MAG TPA: fluoride efflux transporter CrcB [Candidatus Fimivicinus intestinavium]|nr:fluoride efflux transporter CrcB [Candidatus Fimivicinus intestinavium]